MFAVFNFHFSMTRNNLRFLLFGNVYQNRKNKYVAAILQKLNELGVEIYIEEEFAEYINKELRLNTSYCHIFSSSQIISANAAISVGGDGTFLSTAAKIGNKGIPILGINTGHLGFLADVSPEVISTSLEALCRNDYVIEERKALSVMKNGDLSTTYPFALNEIAVLKHDISSLIEIETYIDGHFLTNYLADGLIISTPTGSTAYSLSVGGPILEPQSHTICLSPVAPHSLSVRPVVVNDSVEICLKIHSRTHNFLLSCDGNSESLPDTTSLKIRCAPHTIKVIKIEHKHFFDTLREKMMWGADQRN